MATFHMQLSAVSVLTFIYRDMCSLRLAHLISYFAWYCYGMSRKFPPLEYSVQGPNYRQNQWKSNR